jgi:hypothetical protein
MICMSHSLLCIMWVIITIYVSWGLNFCGILDFPLCSDTVSHLGKSHVCPVVQEYFVSIHVLQVYWNDIHCGLCILVNSSHFFPHAETFCIGHISISYPLLECWNLIHNCICAGSACLTLQTLQKPSISNPEVEVRGTHGSHLVFSSSFHSMSLYTL